jgi:hypothetical protein
VKKLKGVKGYFPMRILPLEEIYYTKINDIINNGSEKENIAE